MNWRTVFDVGEAGYQSWSFGAFGLVFVAIGAGLVAHRTKGAVRRGRRRSPPAWFPAAFLGFALLWTLAAFATTWLDYVSASTALAQGRARVIEGRVSRFVPMPFTGHAMERFCVDDTCFQYSDFVVTAGFHRTSSHGGPIRDGLDVRVTHVGNTIVRLEVSP